MTLETYTEIGMMAGATASLVWLAVTLWLDQEAMRRKDTAELWERRIQ